MKKPILQLVTGALLASAAAVPVSAQLLSRPQCRSATCPDSLFRLEIERMILTEGPLASDRDQGDLRFLRNRIRREANERPADATLWLALSEAEAGLGDPLPAVAAATRALEAGADSALALRAQGAARMRLPGGAADGAALYLAGLDRMTRASAPRFLADLIPMLTPEELDWWRSVDIGTLRVWTRDYWEHRAARAGVPLEIRLAEHMRRSAVAVSMFAPPGTGMGASGDDDVLWQAEMRNLPYDDRGLVYVRRGPPLDEHRVPSDIFSGLPTMTWLYAGVDGSLEAFHFAKSLSSGSGYRLVTAPACDPGYAGSGYGSTASVSVSDGWVMRSAGTTRASTRAAVSCLAGDAFERRANASLNRIAMRQQAARALRAESPRPPFREALPAFFDFYMFRGPDGATDVVVPIVVPTEGDDSRAIESLVTFADETGGVARREATSSSSTARATRVVLSGGEAWGVAYLSARVRPTERATFRVVVRDPAEPETGGMWGGTMPVRSFPSGGISMSDLVLAGSGPATWSRDSTRLFLLPARDFEPGTPVALFYELYDLRPGSTYRTELTVTPLDRGVAARIWNALTGAGGVRLRFDTRAPEDAGSTLQELRTLQLPSGEGRYRLTVRVVSETGAATEASREIELAEDVAQPFRSGAAAEATRATEATEDE